MYRRLFSTITVTVCMVCIFPFSLCSCQGVLPFQKVSGQVAVPVFSPSGGIYYSAQNVSISCNTNDAIIQYSIIPFSSNSEPTIFFSNENESNINFTLPPPSIIHNRLTYSGPIKVKFRNLVIAQASKSGMADSVRAWAIYLIHYPVETPKFKLKPGLYITPLTIEISCNTYGATIRYTIDGSEPMETSSIYSGPITINATTSIMAKGFLKGYPESITANATYSLIELGGLRDFLNK